VVPLGGPGHQQIGRRDTKSFSEALHRPQGDVAFASFETAHVGAMYTDEIREGFLAHAVRNSVRAQVYAEHPLQIALHQGNDVADLLLFGLQTDE
jgi:hypothetical protein